MDHAKPLLEWAGDDLSAHLSESGWFLTDQPGPGTTLDGEVKEALEAQATVVFGNRVAAMNALRQAGFTYQVAYLDVPREKPIDVQANAERTTTWLSVARAHIEAALPLVVQDGLLIVHIDDEGAPGVRSVADQIAGSGQLVAVILWEKKYAAQQDLKGRIDAAHDFLLVYKRTSGAVIPKYKLWAYTEAGKTEDATREFNELRDSAVITLAPIPKTSKPRKLFERIFDEFGVPSDANILEVFSDTGFASIAAVAVGRHATLLAGSTDAEREDHATCSIPALKHLSGNDPTLLSVHSYNPVQSIPDLRSRPLSFGHPDPAHHAVEHRPIIRTGGEKCIELDDLTVIGNEDEGLLALQPVLQGAASVVTVNGVLDGPVTEGGLSLLRFRIGLATSLCAHDGLVVIASEDDSVSAVRLVADMVIGRQRYAGTIVRVGAHNHDDEPHKYLVVYSALGSDASAKIGPAAERTFENPDNDPRGPWRDPKHKGARSGSINTAFEYRVPPYRWKIVDGHVPPGVWRLNEFTGVLWSPELTAVGKYEFTIRAEDAKGGSCEKKVCIEVCEDCQAEWPDGVPWLSDEVDDSGPLRITTDATTTGAVGKPYSILFQAAGGNPYEGVHEIGAPTEDGGRTRYWEFALKTLESAIFSDEAILGPRGDARPTIKRRPDRTGRWDREVELGWWSKEKLGGATEGERLGQIASAEGDLLVDIAGNLDQELALPATNRNLVRIRSSAGAHDTQVGPVLFETDLLSRVINVEYDADDFPQRLAWTEGFLPIADQHHPPIIGATLSEHECCVVLAFDEWPNRLLLRRLSECHLRDYQNVVVYHFVGRRPPKVPPGLTFRRFPFESRNGGRA